MASWSLPPSGLYWNGFSVPFGWHYHDRMAFGHAHVGWHRPHDHTSDDHNTHES